MHQCAGGDRLSTQRGLRPGRAHQMLDRIREDVGPGTRIGAFSMGVVVLVAAAGPGAGRQKRIDSGQGRGWFVRSPRHPAYLLHSRSRPCGDHVDAWRLRHAHSDAPSYEVVAWCLLGTSCVCIVAVPLRPGPTLPDASVGCLLCAPPTTRRMHISTNPD